MHCRMQMPVKTIIRENGKQCMMHMPVKTTLRLYCDNSHLVSNACEIINVLRHSRLVIVDCLLNRHYKKKSHESEWWKCRWKLHCDHTVMTVTLFRVCETTWIWREHGLPQQSCFFFFFFFFFFFSQCVNYMCEGVTRGQSRPIDLKSSFIFFYL